MWEEKIGLQKEKDEKKTRKNRIWENIRDNDRYRLLYIPWKDIHNINKH